VWHLIAEGQHLGYRKTGEIRGSWTARYYTRRNGRRFQALGMADDTAPANGTHVLAFQQALEAAQRWFGTVSRADAAGVTIGPYKVRDAAADWIAAWNGSDASKRNSQSNLKHHILPSLGDIAVVKLTRQQVQDWLRDLAKKPPVRIQQRETSTNKLSPSRRSKVVYDPTDPETKRKRQDTANRIFNDLTVL